MKDIKYLIKFVSKIEYAEQLVSGQLFMRPVSYFHKLEKENGVGQGDLREASILNGVCAYMHTHIPVYCLYTVMGNDITEENTILISQQVIDDFHCKNGYAVLIDFPKFEKSIAGIKSNNYEVLADMVKYTKLTASISKGLLKDSNNTKNIFIKDPFFSYQKEFRIVVCQQVYTDEEKPIYEKIYDFEPSLHECSKVFSISTLMQVDDNYVINLE